MSLLCVLKRNKFIEAFSLIGFSKFFYHRRAVRCSEMILCIKTCGNTMHFIQNLLFISSNPLEINMKSRVHICLWYIKNTSNKSCLDLQNAFAFTSFKCDEMPPSIPYMIKKVFMFSFIKNVCIVARAGTIL